MKASSVSGASERVAKGAVFMLHSYRISITISLRRLGNILGLDNDHCSTARSRLRLEIATTATISASTTLSTTSSTAVSTTHALSQLDMSNFSFVVPQLWQQCREGKFREAIQFLSKQATSKMAVDLLLYSEAHLIHHQNLTADIWVRLVNENLIKVTTLDPEIVSRMRTYVRNSRFVISMGRYITERWGEDWWRGLQFTQVSRGCGNWG
jgi:hypothetical protein